MKKRLSLLAAVLAILIGLAVVLPGRLNAETLILATEHGLTAGTEDAGPALRELLRDAPENSRVRLEAGEYHFFADSSPMLTELYISNHDQQPTHPVGVQFVDKNHVTLEGDGVEFIFHGRMLPLLVSNSSNICLKGISIRYATPFSAEGRIVEQTGRYTTLEMQPDSRWCVEDGKFCNLGDGWKNPTCVAIGFLPDGRMLPSGKRGDISWSFGAEQLSPTRVRFAADSRKRGLSVGDTLVLRSYWRPNPAIFILQSENTTLEHVTIHDSMGMGVLGQRSSNITLRGGGVTRRPGRYGTTGADATHFSNCRGHISVSGCLFEGMMDDAINVHATCLGITEVHSPTEISARFMHHQAYGFELLKEGERVQFIHGPTLENNPQLTVVKSVSRPDPQTLRITLESPLPEGIGTGDALENADWHPRVTFTHNTVRHNRARGALFTTPEPVLVEHNHFDWSSGSAILLAGDAQGWYESGRCLDVTIRHNTFDHCLTSLFQFTEAIISICPEVKQPDAQKERYHRNIRIEHNRFLTHRVPLLSAISADALIFRNNEVIYDDAAPTLSEGTPYRLRHCGTVELQEVTQTKEVQ